MRVFIKQKENRVNERCSSTPSYIWLLTLHRYPNCNVSAG